jgi:SARP family transcriptional regulator, regulator of embCAB operon
MLRFQVLGPLRVTYADAVIPIGAVRLERIMTILVLRANQLVPNTQLITEIWGDEPPERAKQGIHVYVSQLRKKLSAVGAQSPIVTRSPGYALEVAPEALDFQVFRRLMSDGRTHLAAGRAGDASRSFDEAMEIWRVPVLSDIYDGPVASGYVNALDELRLECVEMRTEAEMLQGRHRSLISQLYTLIAEYPLHEAFYAQLMRALSLSERRGDALAVYRKAWEVLDRELGVEPGEKLQELFHSILGAGKRSHMRIA